jgi:hypothetical protein
MNNNSTQRQQRKQKRQRQIAPTRIRGVPFVKDTVLVKMVFANQVLTTTAFGVINTTTTLQSDQCSQFPSGSWASYAARFGQYRVHSMAMHLHPTLPVNSTSAAAGQISSMHFSDFISTYIPTTAAGIVGDSSWREFSTGKPITFRANWARNPNAKLWSPTSAAIPIDRRYGIAYCSHTNINLLPVATIIFTWSAEFFVEFAQAGF